MKSIYSLIFSCLFLLACESSRVDYILSVDNGTSAQLTVEVQIGNQLDTFFIESGKEKVVFSEVCDECEDISKPCLAGIESISVAAGDGRVLSYNPNNPVYWERELSQNNTGYIHRCSLKILEEHLH